MSYYIGILSSLLIFGFLPQILTQPWMMMTADPCTSRQTCRECIETQSCAWCTEANFQNRCFNPSKTTLLSCPDSDTYNPSNFVSVLSSELLTSSLTRRGSSNITQIYPQRVRLSLRANEKYNLKFRYSPAEDYPIDLYYLMDLSKSTVADKINHSNLGEIIAANMKNITSNFKLGFGTFKNKLDEPCSGCAAPYSFFNIMPLSTDTTNFAREVRNLAVSEIINGTETVFDAILQAIVCYYQIGWRYEARRLLVISTDADLSYSDDRRIITSNDGYCHLDSRGMYTYSANIVSPTVSQINDVAKQRSINIIFVVPDEKYNQCRQLSNRIEGSSCLLLSEDLSNVAAVLENEYNKITSSVEIRDTAFSGVEITYFSNCLAGDQIKPTNKCDNLKVGDVVEYSAEVLVSHCPKNPSEWKQKFQIYPVGIDEKLTVELELECECMCERNFTAKSPMCYYHGTYKCGICECDPQYFGERCECSLFDESIGCRANNNITQGDCSGRGSCICGVCECEKRADPTEIISGEYCECDNFSCDRHNDMLCSGPRNGVCECGECRCFDGFTGSACECPADNVACRTD